MKHYFYLFTFISLFSCKPDGLLSEKESATYKIRNISWSDFSSTNSLKGEKINLEQVIYPRQILSIDDYIILAEKKADTLLRVYNKDYQFVRSLGKHGVGPAEILTSSRLYRSDKRNAFYSSSLSNKTTSLFDINQEGVLAQKQIKPINQEMYLASTLTFSSDSTILSTRNNGDDKFVEFSMTGQIINTYEKWSDMMKVKNNPVNVLSSLFQGKLANNPSYSHFSYACLDSDILEILDKKSGVITSIRGPIEHLPKFEVDYGSGYAMCALDHNTIRYCYLDVQMTEYKIYALFSGYSFQEVDVEKKDDLNNQIFVFDLEGNPLQQYKLDFPIYSFSVDEHKKRIYGISNDENPNLVVFHL